MKHSNHRPEPGRAAFTLIELLVVIAIIGVLAALVFPALKAAKNAGTRSKVNAELKQLEIAIEAYKARYGFYPPDLHGASDLKVAPNQNALNQLFYELAGITQRGKGFSTLDDRQQADANQAGAIRTALGVEGFMNSTKEGGGDDSKVAQKFLTGLKADQYAIVPVRNARVCLLVCSVSWPARLGEVIPGVPEVNPWRYNSSNPTHNPKSFDLWVDVALGGKTNRISNWNKSYEFVN